MSELWQLPATELAHPIRTQMVSAREAADVALRRLDAVSPRIYAIVAHRPELVRKQADKIDQMLARRDDLSPLAGVAAGIGHLAVGNDIGGSLRYRAYACGLHGLRPTLGRVPAYNASSPERAISPQLMSATGLIGRTVEDLRVGLTAMSASDPRDP